jgi:hypothetical protein
MKELGSALEEAKADISGLFALQYLIDRGVVPKSMEEPMYVTYLASAFRSIRFGISDAHGKGMALQFNYLADLGAFEHSAATGRFKVNFAKIKDATQRLTAHIMTIQAEGSYEKAKALFDQYVMMKPEMKAAIDKMTDIPTDIAPSFPLADQQK